MIISATLTNTAGCEFDSTTFGQDWDISKPEAASVAKAKRWAAGRGGEYVLTVSKSGQYDAWYQDIGKFRYSGACRRGVAV